MPMVFPLDYTVADAEDILSPGNYLLDAINEQGEAGGVSDGRPAGALACSSTAGRCRWCSRWTTRSPMLRTFSRRGTTCSMRSTSRARRVACPTADRRAPSLAARQPEDADGVPAGLHGRRC